MSDAPFDYRQFPAPPGSNTLFFTFYAKGRIDYGTDKILPTGHPTAVFTYGAPHKLSKSTNADTATSFEFGWVEGVGTTPTYHTPTDGTHVVGIAFRPQGLARLTGQDMSTWTNRFFDAGEVFPKVIIDHVHAAHDTADEPATHDALHTLFDHLASHPIPHWIDAFHHSILEAKGDVDLDALYAELPVSARSTTEAYKKATGLSPKQAARIQRLLALLEAVDPQHKVNWTELAHDHGFYDQAHFNREFKSLTGLYPSRYLDDRRRAYPDMVQGEHVVFAPEELP